ncbi:hypothetical protein BV898_15891 [Hypsibius exemplaris]|uniref:PiggyBac transposable element-derived protein domain-containing protein n=1 Tax=Hypsibius exemplaris TaxID=2072580 RepID=A0A9X6RKN5_HYPEX|nr:hypothetical protein BV898_15891 [Hypsibius exemplaris]
MKVVLRLIEYLGEKSGRNLTTDNFFTSVELAEDVLSRNITLIGTIRKNRGEISRDFLPGPLKDRPLFSSCFWIHQGFYHGSYVCRPRKCVILLSSQHHSIQFDADTIEKKPEIIKVYNATKSGVDTMDQLVGTYSVRRKTNRWPMAFFYDMEANQDTFPRDVMGLICQRLRLECNLTLVQYNWDAGPGFHGLFDTVFNVNTSFSVGIGNFLMRKDRTDVAHLVDSIIGKYDTVIVIDQNDLVAVSGAAFFAYLFRQVASTGTWAGLAAIFAIYAILITAAALLALEVKLTLRGIIFRLWETAFGLFATMIGKGCNCYPKAFYLSSI